MSEGTTAEALADCFGRLHAELGEQTAGRVIAILADTLGGVRLTFPDPLALSVAQRDRLIRAQFRGYNLQELSIRFNISTRHVRRILKK